MQVDRSPDNEDELGRRKIHPALHIEPGFSSVGVIKGKHYIILTSSGAIIRAENIKENLIVTPIAHPQLSDRWRISTRDKDEIEQEELTFPEALGLLIQKWRELQWFDDERTYAAFSVWAAGTYVFQAFLSYPYLYFAGEKGSGKTKAEDVLECVAFNALKVVSLTPATLFRIGHALRPTFLIDEAENMSEDLRTIVNAGYKRGATVPRLTGEDYEKFTFFEAYSPKCLASIQSLGDVTEDRCIVVVMTKAPQEDERQNKPIDPRDTEWAKIRNGFYRLPLEYAEKITQCEKSLSLPAWMRARDRELWSPLLTLAKIADDESHLAIYGDVLGLARELIAGKGLTFESEAILGVLEDRLDALGVATSKIHPGDLCLRISQALKKKDITAEWIGGRLRSLGF